jgi:hypothetical protein
MIAETFAAPGFQTPLIVESPRDCYFYHTMDLPQFGLQAGPWDLRNDVDNYLGHQSFQGKTVVDVGTASGFLCFEMEKKGADVIAFDRVLTDSTDDAGLIPFYNYAARFGTTIEQTIQARLEGQQKLQRSFWLSHRLLGSKARLYCGNAYAAPSDIGQIDYCFFGCILLHLRDPLLALSTFAGLTREKIIITDNFEDIGAQSEAPVMFLRATNHNPGNPGTWWYITPALLKQYLEILGFSKFALTFHHARSVQGDRDAKMYTLVAER